jgi:heat shock protein HtpX
VNRQITSHQQTSLGGRAAIAVLLTIGFYGLAIIVALALLAVPYLEYTLTNRVTGRLAAVCVIGAGIILWSIVPRRDRFIAPGPELTPERNPKLFELLRSVARTVNEPMPERVYLTPDVNAGVFQRGGFLGTGGHRLMIVGLPLLHALTVSEVEGVLAHEFGHYHGGDVKLGPWIYRTRETIGRTLHNLRGRQLLRLPFLFYGTQFLKVTQGISRRQEFAADAMAASIVGSGPMIRGLTRVHRAALAFAGYWQEEYVALLEAGFRAPLLGGFDQFVHQEGVSANLDRAMTAEMEAPNQDPFDSHPTLADRIAALRSFPERAGSQNDATADSLLGDPGEAEAALLNGITRGRGGFRTIDWADVAQTIIVPRAQDVSRKFASAVGSATLTELPAQVHRATEVGRQIESITGRKIANDDVRRRAGLQLLTDMMIATLAANGWAASAPPGAAVVLRRDGKAIEPGVVIARIESGELEHDAWRDEARSLGIGDLPLAATVDEAASRAGAGG